MNRKVKRQVKSPVAVADNQTHIVFTQREVRLRAVLSFPILHLYEKGRNLSVSVVTQ